MSEQSLDDVLAGNEPEDAGEVAETEVEETAQAEESTEAEAKPEKAEESTPDSKSDKEDEPWHLKAVLDEREKRQKAQKELDELRAKLAENKEEQKRPDVFEDQDGAFSHLEAKFSNERLKDRMDMSRDFMSMLKDDYAEREAQFMEFAKEDATLIQKLREHPNPARFAYETAVKQEQVQKMENLDEWREQERAALKKEILEEMKAEEQEKVQKETEKREAITPSLAKGRSDGGMTDVHDDDLDGVLTNMG